LGSWVILPIRYPGHDHDLMISDGLLDLVKRDHHR
jgi:hypothetical protein